MYHINTGVKPFTFSEEEVFYTQEGFSSFFEWLSSIRTHISEAYVTVFQTKTLAITTQAVYKASVYEYVRSASIATLGKVNVHRPSRLGEPLHLWLAHLAKQTASLSDIEERLYDPIIKYLAAVATDEANGDKIWNPRELKLNTMSDFKSAMNKFLSDKRDHIEYLEFEEVYPRQAHFRECYDSLLEIQKTLGTVNIDAIMTKEHRIVELITLLLNKTGPEIDQVISKQNKNRLAESLKSVAEEAEILSVTIYEVNKAITSHNNNVKIISDLM